MGWCRSRPGIWASSSERGSKVTKAIKWGLASAGVIATGAAQAAIDVSDVVSGVGEISVAVLAVLGAMLAVSVAVLGLGKVYAFVKRRAGA